MTIDALTTFLGWCLTLNLGILLLGTVASRLAPELMHRSQRFWFPGLDDAQIDRAVYAYLAGFKALVIVFNFTPYLVLRLFF